MLPTYLLDFHCTYTYDLQSQGMGLSAKQGRTGSKARARAISLKKGPENQMSYHLKTKFKKK